MKYRLSFFLWVLGTVLLGQTPHSDLKWDTIAILPADHTAAAPHPGLAGTYAGVHQEVMILAGGANFPEGGVWEGGTKKFHKDIYVLEKDGDQWSWMVDSTIQLPFPVAYGASVSTSMGLIGIGGNDASGAKDDVFVLRWNAEERTVEYETLPSLPLPLTNLTAGVIGAEVYVAGSTEPEGKKFFGKLSIEDMEEGWQNLPAWPGAPRTHAVGVVQNNGTGQGFYLFMGRFKGNRVQSQLIQDSWVYDPVHNEWEALDDSLSDKSIPLAAGTGMPVGANHILLFGGDDGRIFNQLETLADRIQKADDPAIWIAQRDSLMQHHPGFNRAVWSFHTITRSWSLLDSLPFSPQVTTTSFQWGNQMIFPSGEVSPCIRTPLIRSVQLESQVAFGTLNYTVLAVYLFVLLLIGFIYSKNQNSTDDFFKGGNRIPWWAAGISIFGTQLSAITFMAIPAKTFATDWLYFFLMMTIIMVSPFIIRYFLPFYRRYNLTSAYEFLEMRFNLPTRLVGSTMYIFLQLGRLGIVLLLPSLALSVVTGIDVNLCILTMGLMSILYTVLGGIEAVIWTDVLQVVVLLGGALLSLGILYASLDGVSIGDYIGAYDKMKILDWNIDFSQPTLWVVLIGGLASNIVQYGSDQTVIQRYLTTKDERSAAKGITVGAWMTLPATLIFFSLGTLLFVYYKSQPELLSPVLDKTDAVFPWFIVNGLPPGVSGLLIAAVFAASMSSLDSSMNSVATVITTDFVRRLWPLNRETGYLKMARWITVVIGVMGTGIAWMMATWGISSLWDQFNMIVGLFAGGLGGVFVLGIFFKRASGYGALIGLIASGIIQYLIKEYTEVHLLMYAFTGMCSSVIIGWILSLIYQNNKALDNGEI